MYVHKKYMPHNYCYHSKKSKLIYFEFSSHCLVWLASRLASLHRAEPSLIFWLAKIASRAEPSRAELSSARLVSSPTRNQPEQSVEPFSLGRRQEGSPEPVVCDISKVKRSKGNTHQTCKEPSVFRSCMNMLYAYTYTCLPN